jgi:hypothetical protein
LRAWFKINESQRNCFNSYEDDFAIKIAPQAICRVLEAEPASMQSCGRWLERSKKELVEAALGRLVFGQDEAGTDMPNSAQKFGQINRKSHTKIFSFPSPQCKT